jgi:predicted AAA+ superfamily ATPase
MRFAKDASSRVFYMDKGELWEAGPPEQIFEHPQRQETHDFIFRVRNWDWDVDTLTTDFHAMEASLVAYCQRQFMGRRAANACQLIIEEAVDNQLLGYARDHGIKKPEILQKLLQALSLQLGSEVSYNELSNLLGIDKQTVENYIGLLEKCFVIFRLDSFSRNLRNEIKKGKKVYFYDNGVRNAVISNYAPVELRNDVGALWENLMVSERVKRNAYNNSYARLYFWRTHDQKEIDLIEEEDGRLSAYEFKWNTTAKARVPQVFMQTYPGTSFSIISPDNYWEFVKG